SQKPTAKSHLQGDICNPRTFNPMSARRKHHLRLQPQPPNLTRAHRSTALSCSSTSSSSSVVISTAPSTSAPSSVSGSFILTVSLRLRSLRISPSAPITSSRAKLSACNCSAGCVLSPPSAPDSPPPPSPAESILPSPLCCSTNFRPPSAPALAPETPLSALSSSAASPAAPVTLAARVKVVSSV